MGTSKDAIQEELDEANVMLTYIKNHYPEVYDEATSHYINEAEDWAK